MHNLLLHLLFSLDAVSSGGFCPSSTVGGCSSGVPSICGASSSPDDSNGFELGTSSVASVESEAGCVPGGGGGLGG